MEKTEEERCSAMQCDGPGLGRGPSRRATEGGRRPSGCLDSPSAMRHLRVSVCGEPSGPLRQVVLDRLGRGKPRPEALGIALDGHVPVLSQNA